MALARLIPQQCSRPHRNAARATGCRAQLKTWSHIALFVTWKRLCQTNSTRINNRLSLENRSHQSFEILARPFLCSVRSSVTAELWIVIALILANIMRSWAKEIGR
jgi:hypothetical protein